MKETETALSRYALTATEKEALAQATPTQILNAVTAAFMSPAFVLRFLGAVAVGFGRGFLRGLAE